MKMRDTMIFVTLVISAACTKPDDRVYTLYRNSVVTPDMRAHVATFDADEKETYNRDNCETARALFQHQPDVTVKYWCEKGRFRS